jgi:predicted HAD superfamily hydrolase
MFLYINKFRKDIDAYWFCNSNDLVKKLRSQGFKSYLYEDITGIDIMKKAGVFVTNQAKEVMPEHLIGAKFLNLWHGVGTKKYIERKLTFGDLAKRIAKKYIKYNETFINDQIFLTTSERMEEHFKSTLGLRNDQVIKAGYPRCNYIGKFEYSSYDCNFKKLKGLNADTKIVLVAPTFRDKSNIDYISVAFPDIDKLIKNLKQKNILMIFKMHPIIEKSIGFLNAKEKYSNCQNLLFWDNQLDIYEMFDQIDMAVIDYSSIYYDLIGAGVNRFVRYIFDFDIYEQFSDDYLNMTTGTICYNFDEFINALEFESKVGLEELQKIKHEFWSYDSDDSFEKIIEATLNYKKRDDVLPILYSFDIFDTLIARTVLEPRGVFYYVQKMINKSNLEFPSYFKNDYVQCRRKAEANVREYYKKSVAVRKSNRVEITFQEIFDRLKEVYDLTEEQVKKLMQWELECEYETVIPIHENIDKAKKLKRDGNDVVLISDMYLSKEVIVKFLKKVDTEIAELPLYLSSDYGVQKHSGDLYVEVYADLDYKYKSWKHFGDNKISDGTRANEIGIKTEVHDIYKFDKYEVGMANKLQTYDSFLVARMLCQHRMNNISIEKQFVYRYFTFVTVPYVSWVLKNALEKNTKCLYFIARDGFYLKIIADEIIRLNNYDIKTKYIYGSRKAWRVPSFINEVDEEYYQAYGNFTGVKDFDKLLQSLSLDEETFQEIFPEFKHLKNVKEIDKALLNQIIETAKNSETYNKKLLDIALDRRIIMKKYLKQEINFEENFAFVEYWARGYTQTCLTKVISDMFNEEKETKFYYVRSIYGTIGNDIRNNYTVSNDSLVKIENIFANVPNTSTLGYRYEIDRVVPIMQEYETANSLHQSIVSLLPKFVNDFYNLNLLDIEQTERELFNYCIAYINSTKDADVTSCLVNYEYSETLWGDFNKDMMKAIDKTLPFTWADVFGRMRGQHFKDKTISVEASIQKSSKSIQKMYYFRKNMIKRINKLNKKKK